MKIHALLYNFFCGLKELYHSALLWWYNVFMSLVVLCTICYYNPTFSIPLFYIKPLRFFRWSDDTDVLVICNFTFSARLETENGFFNVFCSTKPIHLKLFRQSGLPSIIGPNYRCCFIHYAIMPELTFVSKINWIEALMISLKLKTFLIISNNMAETGWSSSSIVRTWSIKTACLRSSLRQV